MKVMCRKCGGTNIETKAWIDANDGTVLSACSDGEIDDNWCRDCEEHVAFTFIHDYTEEEDEQI